jgi:hypothetical protein
MNNPILGVNGKDAIREWVANVTKQIMEEEGYNRQQAKSLAWAEYFEFKSNRWLDDSRRFDCYCKDCDEGKCFAAAGSVRYFIQRHRGHKTSTTSYK